MSRTEVRLPRRREQLYQAGMAEELAPLQVLRPHAELRAKEPTTQFDANTVQ